MTQEEMQKRLDDSYYVSRNIHLMDMKTIKELKEENLMLRLRIKHLEMLLHGSVNFVILVVCFLILWFATG